MADIRHDFPIAAPADRVFRAAATPEGLDAWWTLRSAGTPAVGAEYQLYFGPDYDWRAVVIRCEPRAAIEWRLTRAAPDWMDSRVGLELSESGGITQVRFHHTGWPEVSDHYRTSCFCWAMYLRILKRYVEHGETVPYERRLDV